MRLMDIGNLKSRVDTLPLHDLAIWDQEVCSISSIQLLAAHSVMSSKVSSRASAAIISVMLEEIRLDILLGEQNHTDLIDFVVPRETLVMSEVVTIMNMFSAAQKRALLYSLYTGLDLEATTRTKRSDLTIKKSQSDWLNNFIKMLVPNIHTKLAFWVKESSGIPSSMFDLSDVFFEKTGQSWKSFAASAENIFIDVPDDDNLDDFFQN